MELSLSTIIYGVFFAVIGLFSLLAILSVYIYVRYGRSSVFTLASSAVFVVVFIIGVVSALATLQDLISLYV